MLVGYAKGDKMDQVAMTPEVESKVEKTDPVAPLTSNSSHKPLYELFDVEKSERVEQDLKSIWEYAKDRAENKDKDSVLYEVVRLKNRMKSPDVGEKPYLRVLLYVREYMKMRDAEKNMGDLSG